MIKEFRDLLDDERRIKAFQKAIAELVNSDSSVAEIGTALGTYSLFSAQCGARNTYAIEKEDIINVGIALAKLNNLYDRITFIHDISSNTELPEQVDYIIMEDYTPSFLYKGLEEIIVDARNRFLKTGGKFIPNNILIKIAPVSCPSLYDSINLWRERDDILYTLDWSYTTDLVVNQPHSVNNHRVDLLSEESLIKEIDLSKDSNFTFDFTTEVEIQKDGTFHGLVCWWDCWFTPTFHFSNSPLAQSNTWGQMLYPLRYPIKVSKNEKVKIHFQSIKSGNTGDIFYKWEVEYKSSIQEHNTFRGGFLNLSNIVLDDIAYSPRLSATGKKARAILNLIDGRRSWKEIIEVLVDKLPKHFSNPNRALQKICQISQNYYK